MKVKERLEGLKKEFCELETSLKLFPDLEEHRDRWETIRLCTPSINKLTDDVEIRHSCGCCADASLQAWPFKLIQGTYIYSKPTCFFIGQQNDYGYGEIPDPNWQDKLKEADIPQMVIDKIQAYLDNNPPIYDEDEDEDEEDEDYED